jgi:hypothetical protein
MNTAVQGVIFTTGHHEHAGLTLSSGVFQSIHFCLKRLRNKGFIGKFVR